MDCAMSMTDHILFIILQVILFKFEITIIPNSSASGEIECILVINACSATVFAPRILLGTFLCNKRSTYAGLDLKHVLEERRHLQENLVCYKNVQYDRKPILILFCPLILVQHFCQVLHLFRNYHYLVH